MPNTQTVSNTTISLPNIADELLPNSPMVLVCEDEPEIRLLLARVLHENDYIVISTDTAETALKLINQFGDRLNVLVTDIQTAGQFDGVELSRRVKRSFPNLGIIAISGNFNDRMIGDLDALGVKTLRKPFEIPDLLNAIKQAVQSPLLP